VEEIGRDQEIVIAEDEVDLKRDEADPAPIIIVAEDLVLILDDGRRPRTKNVVRRDLHLQRKKDRETGLTMRAIALGRIRESVRTIETAPGSESDPRSVPVKLRKTEVHPEMAASRRTATEGIAHPKTPTTK